MSSPPPPDPAETRKRLTGLRDYLVTCLGGVGTVTSRTMVTAQEAADGKAEAGLDLDTGWHRFEVTIREIR